MNANQQTTYKLVLNFKDVLTDNKKRTNLFLVIERIKLKKKKMDGIRFKIGCAMLIEILK